MSNFSVEITETSREFTKRERVMLKDTGNANKLDEIVSLDNPIIITPVAFAILKIHNEMGSNPDYKNIVIFDDENNKYITGSPTFMDKFFDIWAEMYDPEEPFQIEIYKRESKNYKGKSFISCAVV
jgi:intein/homing endonuclease